MEMLRFQSQYFQLKKFYSSFLKKVFVFQTICFKFEVLKTFKTPIDCFINNKNDNPNKLVIAKKSKWLISHFDFLAMISLFGLSFLLFILRLSSGTKFCFIKTCWSITWTAMLKIPSTFFRRTYALSIVFKMKPLRKKDFPLLRQKRTQTLP